MSDYISRELVREVMYHNQESLTEYQLDEIPTADVVDRIALRDALYDADAITMEGVKIINRFPTADTAEVLRRRVPQWISVEERRPEYRKPVLFMREDGNVRYATDSIDWDDGGVSFFDSETDMWVRGTDWMPLPEPPSTEDSPTGQKG